MLVERSTERERAILLCRLATFDKRTTLAELGSEYGCTQERVRQIEAKLGYRIGREIARRDSVARGWHSSTTRSGPPWQMDAIAEVPGLVGPVLTDLSRVETRLLLWAAGPFEITDGWLVRRPSRRTIEASRQRLRAATARGPIPVSEAIDGVGAIGIRPQSAEAWIGRLPGFHTDDKQVARNRRR